jgi:hypothetical protein
MQVIAGGVIKNVLGGFRPKMQNNYYIIFGSFLFQLGFRQHKGKKRKIQIK